MRNLIDAIVGASACILAVFLAIVTIGSLMPDDEERKP
jgi:hypothetical protein